MNQHYRKYSLDYFLECQHRIGFESVELWCGSPHFWIDPQGYDDCSAIRKKAAARGISIVSVTVPSFLWQYQCAAESGLRAEQSFRYFSNGIHAASELQCKIMTVNSGWGIQTEPKQEAWKRAKDFLARLCDVAQHEGVILALEALRNDESNIVNDITSTKRMFDEIGHPSLKVMVDTIAMGAAGESLNDWFDVFGRDLAHSHFLDGDPHVHNIWGDGNYPLEDMLQTMNDRGYEGLLVQEVADERYFDDPALADERNMAVLERFIED